MHTTPPAPPHTLTLSHAPAELEASNRALQAQVHSLQQDQVEVSTLLQDFRAEQAAHSSLQAAHTALQVRAGHMGCCACTLGSSRSRSH